MSPDEKIALDQRARVAGISTAEFVRRRIGPDEFDGYRDEIDALLTLIEQSGPKIIGFLDSAIARADRAIAAVDRIAEKTSE